MDKDNIENILLDFLHHVNHPFDVKELFDAMGMEFDPKKGEEFRHIIMTIDDFVMEKECFYPKSHFLESIPLRILPTQFEISQGILIPGHRLLPFHPLGMSAGDITFQEKGSNRKVKTKNIDMKMKDLMIYFNLMNIQKLPIVNIEGLLEEDADLIIKVCLMDKFYDANNFQFGDNLIIRPLNLEDGHFSLEYDSYENYQANIFEISRTDKLFMTTLKKVLKKDLFFPNVEKQLLYTYFYLMQNKQFKTEIPGTALGPLLGESKEITFSPLPNGKTTFHFLDQDIDDLAYPDFNELLEGDDEELDLESINGILRFLNNNNGITTVRALLFDMITQKKRFIYTDMEVYLFDSLEKPYMPAEIRKVFKELLQQEYRKIKNDFDLSLAYLPITTSRQKILEQSLVISRFLRSLDVEMVRLDDLPKNEMMHLMELYQAFEEILIELDRSQTSGTCKSSEVHRVLKIVDKVSTEIPGLLEAIGQKIGI